MKMDDDATKFLRGYVRNCAPVQWVAWWGNVTDPLAKQQLYDILFDPETDALRDLTQPHIREEMATLVLQSDYLQELVWAEVRPHLEKLASQEENNNEDAV